MTEKDLIILTLIVFGMFWIYALFGLIGVTAVAMLIVIATLVDDPDRI